jgi:hypothetical protein
MCCYNKKSEECKRNAQEGSLYCWQHRNYELKENLKTSPKNLNLKTIPTIPITEEKLGKLPIIKNGPIQDLLKLWKQPIRVRYYPEDEPLEVNTYDTTSEMEEELEDDIGSALEIVSVTLNDSYIDFYLKEGDHGSDYFSTYIWLSNEPAEKYFNYLQEEYPDPYYHRREDL